MTLRYQGISALAVASLAALPAIDGSFLVRGLTHKSQAPAPVFVQTYRDKGTPAEPQVRCPMRTIEGDPKIDPKLARKPAQNVKFAIRVEPPACTP